MAIRNSEAGRAEGPPAGSAFQVLQLVGGAVPVVGVFKRRLAAGDGRPVGRLLGVDGDEVFLIARHVFFGDNGFCRAFRHADGTVDTLVGIDDEHVGTFPEAVHRAYIDAVGVFAADAIIEHDVKLFIHCNPHNPVGHVWTEEEMGRLFGICKRHHVLIISDEIHQDLITGPTAFTSSLTVKSGAYVDNMIAMSSLSKSFNMASLHHAEVIIPNEKLRSQFNAYKAHVYHTDSDVIAETAITAAYTHPEAEAWLTDVLAMVRENYEYLCRELCTALPKIRISPMDGTYLAWIDFSAYVKPEDMHDLFENKCRLAPSFGEWFGGESYATFVRLNLATSLENIKSATHSIIRNI